MTTLESEIDHDHNDHDHDHNNDRNDDLFATIERIIRTPVLNSYATVGDILPQPSLITHPILYMGTLVRIGYEPMPPTLTKSIFGRTRLQLPGFFTYMRYIAQIDGFWGCYRGLKYHLIYSIVYQFTSVNIDRYQKEYYYPDLKNDGNHGSNNHYKIDDIKFKDTNHLTQNIVCDCGTRIVALAVAYPLHLIMIRSMAQFIGRETYYDTLTGAIADIYETSGLTGFYAGFAPFVIGECIFIFLESSLIYVLRDKFEQLGVAKSNSSFLTSTVANLIARTLVYPFKVVSTVMSCNGTNCRSLAASAYTVPEYANWIDCFQTLYARGEIKRGSSIWWRYQPITSSLMFPMSPMLPFKANIRS